ncbi:MAG TPA: N-acetylmuramoyl-L-alanine amidase [bacterium]|nr:N-acetylmuramoyl-L-alanine amidase [bacterium]HPR86607.1 N-acetylmuramoyl-L-alanine amidase [bacterium]
MRHTLDLTRGWQHLLWSGAAIFTLLASPLQGREVVIRDQKSQSVTSRLATIQAGRYEFVPLTALAEALQIPHEINASRKQFILQIPHNPVIVHAINPFLRVGTRWQQMPVASLIIDGEYYAPIDYFLAFVRTALPFGLVYDPAQATIWIVKMPRGLAGIQIDDMENGTLIRIGLNQPIQESNLFISESNGWLYADLYGGSIAGFKPASARKNTRTIDRISIIQLSRDTARLGFRLLKKVKEREVKVSASPPEIRIALRTHAEVPAALLDELDREREKWKIDLIVIDPGHGGRDPGALGPGGTREKDFTLKIAREIRNKIERDLKIKVIMTRDADKFVPLEDRGSIANRAGGKLFISIHADSNPKKGLRGHTVYFMGPAKTEEARRVAQFENSVIKFEDANSKYANLSETSFILAANAQNSYNKESEEFAALLDRELKSSQDADGFGVRQAGFYVLHGTSMPNVLLETAFISNKTDEKLLGSRSFQLSIAESVCASIKSFKDRYESAF